MKVKRNIGYVTKNENKPIKLTLDINTLDILCRFVLSEHNSLRSNQLINLRKLINILDPSTYNNDPEKQNRINFIIKGLEARLDYHLNDRKMILTHINGGLVCDIDFIDLDNVELNKDELNWVNGLISETLQYQFLYNKVDEIQDVCTRFSVSDYNHRGNIVHEFEGLIDELKNDFRTSKVDDNSIDMEFSLRDGDFENSVTDTYNIVTNPNRRLLCGMSGLNDLVGGGFEAGRVYMFLGVGGVGKSLTLLNLMMQFKKYNKFYKTKDPTKQPCIVMLTMENTVVETISRLFSMSDPNGGSMKDYTLDEVLHILRTNGELYLNDESPIDIFIKYKANKSVDTSYLYTLTEDLEDRGYEVICMIQDHVKRIRSIYDTNDLRIELGDIVNEMKVYAADKDIPVITVSHLNRDATKIIEDGAAKGATADITMKLGKSNVGESLLMVDNLDCGINIGLEFDKDGNRYLGFNLIKMRDKTIRQYIAQPFVYGSTIRLVEDLGTIPAFKESLRATPGVNRVTSVKTNTNVTAENFDALFSDAILNDNAFSNAGIVKDLKEEAEPRKIICPIYYIDDVKPDMSKANEIRDRMNEIRRKSAVEN